MYMDLLELDKELVIVFRDLYVKENYKLSINEDNLKAVLSKFVSSRLL